MAEIDLTQAEADALLAMEKLSESSDVREFPSPGERVEIPLVSVNKRERFILDLSLSALVMAKGTYQNRARQVIVLARLDFGGKPHRNPDDEEVPAPHLHLYREGYGDNGRFRFRRTSSGTWTARKRCSMISCSSAISRGCPPSSGGFKDASDRS